MNKVETQFYTFAEQPDEPFQLASGETLGPVTLAYETYGELAPGKDNAILLFHALSGSQHAAGHNEAVTGAENFWTKECQAGWWDDFVGPDKALDTNTFFVICINYLGGCYGSTGPSSINPDTGKPYAGDFPRILLNDIVDSQLKLLDHLGIEKLHAVIGGSVGGSLAQNLAVRYPERVQRIASLAAGIKATILQRIHNFEQIFAIEEDAKFNRGFYDPADRPIKGLALARMISQKTFISLRTIERRSHGEIIQHEDYLKRYELTHQVESYMLHQAKKFVQRFDANTYLRIMDAWQNLNLLTETETEDYAELFARCSHQKYQIFSIDSDVCFYPEEQKDLVNILSDCGIACDYVVVHSIKGHDSFLIEPEFYTQHLKTFLSE